MKALFITLTAILSTTFAAQAQNNVGINNSTPNPSAALMVDTAATGPQGLLAPRMTQARRNAIATPATGLMIYQTDNTPGFYYFNGTSWGPVASGPGSQLYATSTSSQTKTMYGYSRYTFNFDNVVASASPASAAWTGNSTYTVPTGMGGLYQVNLGILMTSYTYPQLPIIYPEIQVTSGANIMYYYGVGNSNAALGGNNTDATALIGTGVTAPISYGRGVANVTVPLAAGDVVKVFIRSSQNATSSTYSASFSTDGSTYLNILKLN